MSVVPAPIGRWFLSVSLLLALSLSLALGCGTVQPEPEAETAETGPRWEPGPAISGGIQPILATTLLRTGPQRVSFLLTSPEALVKAPEATVTTSFLGGDGGTAQTATAKFHLWPYAIRGAYSADLTFDQPGRWRLDISVEDQELSGATSLTVQVDEALVVPDVGAVPPASVTKTLESEGGLKTLTTDYSPDPDLYLNTVAEAIAEPKPAVIVFATPAFCTSPTCGPQVDTVSELKEDYPRVATYVHVEIYDNPHEIQGDLDLARLAPAVAEWQFDQIPDWFNESWTYVLDSQGRVHQKYEGFVSKEELEAALQEVLAQG